MKEILCFGDSNTYGLIPGTKERYSSSQRWTGILAENIKELGFLVTDSIWSSMRNLLKYQKSLEMFMKK